MPNMLGFLIFFAIVFIAFVVMGAWGVAVAGWQWDRWKEEVGAVRMVVVGTW
jgi:hypothetical protein